MASANTFVKCIAEVSKSPATFTAPSLAEAEDVVEDTDGGEGEGGRGDGGGGGGTGVGC